MQGGGGGVMRRVLAIAALIFVIDQITKVWIVFGLDLATRGAIDVLPPYLNVRMAWNPGINFGLFAGGLMSLERGSNTSDSGAYFYDVYECEDGQWLSVAPIEARFHEEFLRRMNISAEEIGDQRDRANWDRARAVLALGPGLRGGAGAAGGGARVVDWISVPIGVATLGVLMVPVVGLLSSSILIGEALTSYSLVALALILLALTTVMPVPRIPLPWRRSATPD